MKKNILGLVLLVLISGCNSNNSIKTSKLSEKEHAIAVHFNGISLLKFSINKGELKEKKITNFKIVGSYYQDKKEINSKVFHVGKISEIMGNQNYVTSISYSENNFILKASSEEALFQELDISVKEKSTSSVVGFSNDSILDFEKDTNMILNVAMKVDGSPEKEFKPKSIEEITKMNKDFSVIYIVFE